jgi:SpoVK/Ycf46/Vps4 family AAA+-type ATPase
VSDSNKGSTTTLTICFDLLPALQRLDGLLERAVVAAQVAYGPLAAADPYRGLYISQDEVLRLLARQPGAPVLNQERDTDDPTLVAAREGQSKKRHANQQRRGLLSLVRHKLSGQADAAENASEADGLIGTETVPTIPDRAEDAASLPPSLADEETEAPFPAPAAESTRLEWLAEVYGLSRFDLDLILIALAPELDRRYERLYAYLQDDVTRRWPSVDLALNLLCPDAAAKLDRRVHFASDAPLIRHGLLHLIPGPNQLQTSLLVQYFKLDGQIVRLLLGQESLDPRLASFCQLVEPVVCLEELPLSAEVKQTLPVLVRRAEEAHRPLRLYFHGPRGAGQRRAAEALAGEAGLPLLVVDLLRALDARMDFEQVLRLLFREAWFQDAILFLEGLDALRSDERTIQYERLLAALTEDAGITILAGVGPWVPSGRAALGVIGVPFPIPDFPRRRECWRDNLVAAGISLNGHDLDALAGRFRLTPNQIAEAVAVARGRALWRAAARPVDALADGSGAQPVIGDLFAAARAQTGHDLEALTHKIEPVYTWDDIVLPDDTLAQLREICQWVAHRHRVLGDWGFDHKLSLGKGVTALFAGPSGTGKTMAAEIIAAELGLDLYKIDLSGVVSKYIGETEKNLDRIFSAAENANAILFFDEADALFGKRSEVRDSHDRYANIEISYLLQKMEEYDGIAILATNLRQNLDESFIRRMAFTVHFPFPDEDSRRRIWAGIWPQETPLADDPSTGSGQAVDLDYMARRFKLSGGNIKNIALAGAFLAAEDGGTVTMSHLLQATRREYQKMGKVLSAEELDGARG